MPLYTFFGLILIFFMGVIGIYTTKMFKKVKSRPINIIKDEKKLILVNHNNNNFLCEKIIFLLHLENKNYKKA